MALPARRTASFRRVTGWTVSSPSPADEEGREHDEGALRDHDAEEGGRPRRLREVAARVRLPGGEDAAEHHQLHDAPDRGADQRGRGRGLALHRADRDPRPRAVPEGPRLAGGTGAAPPALRELPRATEEHLLLDGADRSVTPRQIGGPA